MKSMFLQVSNKLKKNRNNKKKKQMGTSENEREVPKSPDRVQTRRDAWPRWLINWETP